MPETTNGAPYPAASDPNDVPGDIQALAEWADEAIGNVPSVLASYLGQVGGAVVKPAAVPPTWDAELWRLANFRAGFNTSTLTPSLTADSNAHTLRTLVALGNLANQDLAYRVSFQVDSIPVDGWAEISVAPVDAGGTIIAGAVQQTLANDKSGAGTGLAIPVEFDFKAGAWAVGDTYLDLRLDVFNNATSGTLAISNVSVKQIAAPQRPLSFGNFAGPALHTSLFDPVSGAWRMAATTINDDGALSRTIVDVVGYNTDRPFRYDPADPDFLAARLGVGDRMSPEIQLTAGQVARSLRINNNDQIFSVKKTDGSYELRGNVHGGETLRSGAANSKLEYDAKGNGAWAAWDGTGALLRACRKFRAIFNTQLQRSDAGSPFANVDHTCTFFPDGMMRMDRTTTFVADQRISHHFDWMSSHNTSSPKLGRTGNGLIVLDEVDVFPKVAVPTVPANTPSTSGGLLPAAGRYYAVTALSEGGETTASPTVSVTNTGSTSSNALSWAAVSGATGYHVYRGASPTTLSRIATVAAAASPTYTDTGAAALGIAPPPVNRARQLDATSSVFDAAISDRASWAVWYDPIANLCFGNIYDRESLAARADVASVKVRLERGAGIMKNYINAVFVPDGGNPDVNADSGVPTRLIASGTVWAATHWAFSYVPADPVQYHLEIAARATDLAALKAAYPTS